jgi:hypothetical protein
MAKITAAEAGRKGGKSRSTKKLAAARKNGFQPCKTSPTTLSSVLLARVERSTNFEKC